MKPCKGCCYFRTTVLGNRCDYYACDKTYTDPLSQEKIRRIEGAVKAEDMRSKTGDCGPDRKLYDTFTKQFRRWIEIKFLTRSR